MQVKKQRGSEDPQRDDKKPSCFSNIKIFLVAECALMLAQGTVGAYLVSKAMLFIWLWISFTRQALEMTVLIELTEVIWLKVRLIWFALIFRPSCS